MLTGQEKSRRHRKVNSRDIKKIRRKLGISQRKLAGLCGVSPRTVQGWELGRPPSGAAVKLLMNAEKLAEMTPDKVTVMNEAKP